MDYTKHGKLSHGTGSPCMDSEGNMFPSFNQAAKFHKVSRNTVECDFEKPNFFSKYYNKLVTIIMISDFEFNNCCPWKIKEEIIKERLSGEHKHIYAILRPGETLGCGCGAIDESDKFEIVEAEPCTKFGLKWWYRKEDLDGGGPKRKTIV